MTRDEAIREWVLRGTQDAWWLAYEVLYPRTEGQSSVCDSEVSEAEKHADPGPVNNDW